MNEVREQPRVITECEWQHQTGLAPRGHPRFFRHGVAVRFTVAGDVKHHGMRWYSNDEEHDRVRVDEAKQALRRWAWDNHQVELEGSTMSWQTPDDQQ